MRLAHRFVTRVSFLLAAVAVLLAADSAAAQGLGVRGGISMDPGQIYFGGHYESPALIEHLHFKPNIEIGFGDDTTLVAANFEFVYKFGDYSNWHFYGGGGPSVNFYSFHEQNGVKPDGFTGGGVNVLVGAESRDSGLFFEVKGGFADSPNVKFAVGWNFR